MVAGGGKCVVVVVVSAAVERVAELLGKFRFVPVKTIQRECFPNATESSQRELARRALLQLKAHGLVSFDYLHDRRIVYYLTEQGAAAFDVEGGRGAGVKLAEFDHDVALLNLYFVLRADPRVTRILTEREARSEGPDPDLSDWAVPIVRESGKAGHAWPDIITEGSNGRWGHEVEWTPKNKQRLRRLMQAYAYDTRYTGAVYYYTDASQSIVTDAATMTNEHLDQSGIARQIITKPLSDALGEPQ